MVLAKSRPRAAGRKRRSHVLLEVGDDEEEGRPDMLAAAEPRRRPDLPAD